MGFGLFVAKLIINNNGMIVIDHHAVGTMHIARRCQDVLFGEDGVLSLEPVAMILALNKRLQMSELLTQFDGLLFGDLPIADEACECWFGIIPCADLG